MNWERTASAVSPAPVQRVWDVLLDGRRWSEWNPGVQWMVVEAELVPGTVLTMKPKGAPQTAFRIEAAAAPRLLALELTIGPVARLRLRWELASGAQGTTIAQTVAVDGPLAGLLLKRAAERIAAAIPGDLERLAARACAAPAGPA